MLEVDAPLVAEGNHAYAALVQVDGDGARGAEFAQDGQQAREVYVGRVVQFVREDVGLGGIGDRVRRWR